MSEPEREYTQGETWGALRNSWRGYKIAKVKKQREKMVLYAERIRKLQLELKLPQSDFPDLGLKGAVDSQPVSK